jgi:hypothetical protein
MEAKTFAIGPAVGAEPGSGLAPERELAIELDPVEPPGDARPLLVERVELWRGEGVIDY